MKHATISMDESESTPKAVATKECVGQEPCRSVFPFGAHGCLLMSGDEHDCSSLRMKGSFRLRKRLVFTGHGSVAPEHYRGLNGVSSGQIPRVGAGDRLVMNRRWKFSDNTFEGWD